MSAPLPPRRPPPFRPHFTLSMLYVVAVWFLYCFALAAAPLYRILMDTPAGPEQQQLANEAMQAALAGGRVVYALLAAAVTVGLLGYARWLPGMQERP